LAAGPDESVPIERQGAGLGGHSWRSAAIRASALVILSWAGFLLIPDRLMAFLSTRVTPHSRDALVTLWVVVFFVALCRVFVILQRRREKG
jgi:hypothetical protein